MTGRDLKALLGEAREILEALWDCSVPCTPDAPCVRCAFLARLDEARRTNPSNEG